MIILTAGHTGAGTGAQCATTQFDEGAETIWLRNRVAEILTNKYGLAVLLDNDTASLQLLTQSINALSCRDARFERPLTREGQNPTSTASPQSVQIRRATLAQQESESLNPDGKKSFQSVQSVGENLNPEGTQSINQRSLSLWRKNSVSSVASVRENWNKQEQSQACLNYAERRQFLERSEKNNSVRSDDFVIDIHFNAHGNSQARGTETIVSDDATELELRMASRLAHTTSDALDIPLRCIKSESETPHHRLAMLHLTPQSIILEVCFCTSPEDVEAYRKHRRKIANTIARTIAELILDRKT